MAKPGISRAISLRVKAPRPVSRPSSAPDRDSRVGVVADGDEQCQGDEEDRQGLRHHQRVVDPQVRIDGGDRRGDQAGSFGGSDPHRAGEPAPGEADDQHGRDPEQRHRQALREHGVAGTDAPRREVQRRQHPVLGAGLTGQRVLEPLALGVQAGLDREVDRIVEQQRLVGLGDDQVPDPPGGSEGGDQQQTPAETHGRPTYLRSVDLPGPTLPVRGAQVLLEDLAARVARQGVNEVDARRALVGRQPSAGKGDDGVGVGVGVRPGARRRPWAIRPTCRSGHRSRRRRQLPGGSSARSPPRRDRCSRPRTRSCP